MLVTLKLQHRVYDMFQNFRSGNAAFLIDMPDKQYRGMRFFGKAQDTCRTFAHLCDASRGGFNAFRRNSLYRVDDHQLRTGILDVNKNLFQ